MLTYWRPLAVLFSGLAATSMLTGPAIMPVGRRHNAVEADVLSAGLKLWRKPGAIQSGAACATCHSPDGIELAAYNFTDADLKRRALPHLGSNDSDLLVQYIHALRSKLNLKSLRDPILDRPRQPGGAVLPGNSPAERDAEFGKELSEKLPLFFAKPLATEAEAQAAQLQLLDLQMSKLRIGIPMNRLSEDVFHGNDHALIAQWLPELPPLIAARSRDAWYDEEDRYLANPTIENLRALIMQHFKFVKTERMLNLPAISAFKFRSLLIFQDKLRHHTESDIPNVAPEIGLFGGFNSIWEVGDFVRGIMGQKAQAIGMGQDIASAKTQGASLNAQLHEMRISWFMAGWLEDQGLFKTSHQDNTRLGLWLSQSLSEDGPYPIHNVFASARRQAVITNDIAAWGEPLDRRRPIWDFAGLRLFGYHERDIPKDPAYRKQYITFTANCFRMNLLLLKAYLERTNIAWIKISTSAGVKELVRFIDNEEPETKTETDKLKQNLLELISNAKERFY